MHTRLIPVVLLLGFAAGSASAAGGLTVDAKEVPWPTVQARVGLAATAPLATSSFAGTGYGLQGGRVLGDYYFGAAPLFGSSRVSGAFRATSGVLLGAHGASLSMATVPRIGGTVSVSQQSLNAGSSPDSSADGRAVPYVGVGYTGLGTKGGWGFTADVGVMGLSSGPGLRLDRSANSASLDDTLRELRLTPVLQVGLSYAF